MTDVARRITDRAGGRIASHRVGAVREILELLERDAHLSHDTIATMTGLPVEQVAAQVAAWEASGVIRRYTAVVDWDRAAAAAARQHPRDASPRSSTSRSPPPAPSGSTTWRCGSPASPRCAASTSSPAGHDLRCTVTGRNIRAVSDFVSQKLSTIDRVQATATHFVLKAYKRDGVAFVDPEPDHRLPVTP